jgi:hypothetical protein
MAARRGEGQPDRDVFFGERGTYQLFLQDRLVAHFGSPRIDASGLPRWFAYCSWEDGVEPAQTLRSRPHTVLVERPRWRLVSIQRAGGDGWVLLGRQPKLHVAAQYLGQPPEGMSDEQMFEELIRLAKRARAIGRAGRS